MRPTCRLKPAQLRCEYLANPLAIDTPQPRLSWILETAAGDVPGARQTAYEINVRRDSGAAVWRTGKVRSDESLHIPYAGQPLAPAARYDWRVRVWDDRGLASAWSPPANWTMGLWGPGWTNDPGWDGPSCAATARWIAAPAPAAWNERESLPATMLRKGFPVKGPVRRAVVYASALGLYELRLNGRRVGDQVLAPEWTDYHTKAQYQGYKVTELLQTGENALGVLLGAGWYAGRIGMAENFAGVARGVYGRRLAFIVQLRIELASGELMTLTTDGSWKCTTDGPIRSADLLDGEVYDARREMPGWDAAGFDDAGWTAVATIAGPPLVAQPNEPIRITRRLPAAKLTEPAPGVFIFDVGQNMVGWARLQLRGVAGQEIQLRYGEVLNPDGSLYRDNLRGAPQIDRYVCRGEAAGEQFEPHFTYHGFRYVEVVGLGYRPAAGDLEGCVFHSAAPEVGAFESSSDLLNRVFAAIQWTQRGNFHSVPTDCPQRDERLGWMGDMQVFSQTAIFNMDLAAFLTKWSRDIREAQADDGRFPDFAPHPYGPNARFSGNPGWGDAGVIVPWRAYLNYGDRRLLEEQFTAAAWWIEWSARHNPGLIWRNASQLTPLWYGDWLNGDTFVGLPDWPKRGGEVPKEIYSTAFFAYSAGLVARMAAVLGRKAEASRYRRLAGKIRAAFCRAFVAKDGTIQGDTQAGYALALSFDLLPARLRPLAARHLARALEPYAGSMSTGIQSTVRMMLELSRYGYHEAAYALATRTTMPSWGYMVEHGGTTIWERWDGWVEGRGFQNPSMNSFNHYAIGAVGEWFYRVIGGINPDEAAPGYRHFTIRPVPGGGLTWAKVEYRSIRGRIRTEWRIENGRFHLEVIVPGNTTATVHLPGKRAGKGTRVGAGAHRFEAKL